MKRILNSLALAALVVLVAPACNKDKKVSKRLSGETYTVSSMTVGGTAMPSGQMAAFDECDIYDESCVGHWTAKDLSKADFYWQSRDGGDTFEIANSSTIGSEANYDLVKLTGTYNIDDEDKEMLTVSSSFTNGYKGMPVVITFTKN